MSWVYYYDLSAKTFGKLLAEDLQANYENQSMKITTVIELKNAKHLVWLMRRMLEIDKPSYALMPDTLKKIYVHQIIQEERPDFFYDGYENLGLEEDDDMWREVDKYDNN